MIGQDSGKRPPIDLVMVEDSVVDVELIADAVVPFV
jgi:hypothetical protein